MLPVAFLISVLIIAIFIYAIAKKKPTKDTGPDQQIIEQLLAQNVLFYQALTAGERTRFEKEAVQFLQRVRITGIKTIVTELDRVLIAAAAIIPIFSFKGWQYHNIHEVLLYPGTFSHDYQLTGEGRDTLGMVGNGPLQNVMILSQQDLRDGFSDHSDTSNTAIHEFAHLIDKTDGETDGMPEALLSHAYAIPWLKRIHEEIQNIKAGHSDINPYGTTNEAEFFAVASEYFFEQPHLMEEKHPELFALLQKIFMPENGLEK